MIPRIAAKLRPARKNLAEQDKELKSEEDRAKSKEDRLHERQPLPRHREEDLLHEMAHFGYIPGHSLTP